MTDDLEIILARVAAGEITAEEAEPLVAAAVDRASDLVDGTPRPAEGPAPPAALDPGTRPQRNVRLQVTERGRAMVDLRIPIGLAGLAGAVVPGLSGPQAERIRDALRTGRVGPVLEVLDEHGDGVVISTE
ncbi:MAG: hypothetical protein H0X20_05845 [Chloroflexi bacterium]|nr:hypothetical protein [Chloroflexota bacterium]